MNTLALLPNLAGPDMIIIFVIVLIMFGAKKLPEFAKGLGQAVREFSKAKDNVNQELHNASQVVEHSIYHPPVDTHALPAATAPAPAPVSLSKPAETAAVAPAAPAATPAHTVEATVSSPAIAPTVAHAPAQAPTASPIPEALKPQV
jgi:TatA/E family protein of Tat protein translocase